LDLHPLQLSNILSTESLFYACIFPFIIFFGAFAFVLYPLRDTLHPTGMPQSRGHTHDVRLAHMLCGSNTAGGLVPRAHDPLS